MKRENIKYLVVGALIAATVLLALGAAGEGSAGRYQVSAAAANGQAIVVILDTTTGRATEALHSIMTPNSTDDATSFEIDGKTGKMKELR